MPEKNLPRKNEATLEVKNPVTIMFVKWNLIPQIIAH
jgi:hypothetical protein